jgi:hypothetical protein
MGQPELAKPNRGDRKGLPTQDRTVGQKSQRWTAGTGQVGQDSHDRQPKQDSLNRTVRKRQPEKKSQDCRDMTA